jgi:dephospho-CoA kinase
LTGGIACGKSIVGGILQEKGCYLHSADQEARDLMKPGKPAWTKVVEHFGPSILNSDRTINRPRLAGIIFSDEKERTFLNALIHPLVLEKKKDIIRNLKKEGRYKIFLSEAALTIESGFAANFDKVIVVHCREELQIQRLIERDGLPRREALKRIRAQMPLQKKMRYADYTIDTSGTLLQTREQTDAVYQALLRDYEQKLSGRP